MIRLHNRYLISGLGKMVLILFSLFLFSMTSCSKRQFASVSPASSGDPGMQAFLNGGAGMKLNTGRVRPDQVIKSAEQYLGTPHCMGGITPKCLDCSGLTYLSFGAHKIALPRNSQDQARFGRIIQDRSSLQRGDLVFFTRSYNTSDYITHVGIYLGRDRFIHASTSSGVIVTPLSNPWWSQRFVFGTRVFR